MRSGWGLFFGILATLGYTTLIALSGLLLAHVPHAPDQGASWYYWKLEHPTLTTRAVAWGCYALHQLALWALIYWGQQRRSYSDTLRPLNWIALLATAVFCLLHVAQTHLFYDGLAQDVSIWSALASVAFLLIWVLLMENDRRGLFFGKRMPFSAAVMDFARRYHGYVFAWAIVYTFWYHPTENTFGHLAGFFYIVLIMVQGSLMYTPAHTNRYWTFTLEALVLVHGTSVAIEQGTGLWPMFLFGFASIFIITQMYGLGLPRWARIFAIVVFVTFAAFLVRLDEVVRIPFIDYASVFVLAGLLTLLLRARKGGETHSSSAR